jgi:hypothetical protein
MCVVNPFDNSAQGSPTTSGDDQRRRLRLRHESGSASTGISMIAHQLDSYLRQFTQILFEKQG